MKKKPLPRATATKNKISGKTQKRKNHFLRKKMKSPGLDGFFDSQKSVFWHFLCHLLKKSSFFVKEIACGGPQCYASRVSRGRDQ